jgi:hypothetical protein
VLGVAACSQDYGQGRVPVDLAAQVALARGADRILGVVLSRIEIPELVQGFGVLDGCEPWLDVPGLGWFLAGPDPSGHGQDVPERSNALGAGSNIWMDPAKDPRFAADAELEGERATLPDYLRACVR